MFDFQRTFRPTPEQKIQHDEFALKVMKQALSDKSCSTCVHGHAENIPKFGVVTICDRGGDRARGDDIALETCERYQVSEKEVEQIKELEETIKREKEAAEEKRKQERRELLTARGTSKTRTQFIEKYGFDPWVSSFEQQIARRAVFAEDVIFKIKSHYTAGIEWADRRFNDGLDVAISEINRADAVDAKKIANAVLNQISKVADVEEVECETIPATVESAVAFLRLNGWLEAHDKEIRADERHSMEMWARNPGQGGW